MGKKVLVTEKIKSALRFALDDPEADPSKFSIFEANMVSTAPLSKGGFWNKARISASTLMEMKEKLNASGGAIPLQIMHDTDQLPIGKVFNGALMSDSSGETTLHSLFALSNAEEKIVHDIENSIVDEVSVGLLTKHAFCSECEFDYFGKDASFENFFSLTCDKGHIIGEDGVHVRLTGLEHFSEMSLVGKGASKNAKILPRAKQSMGQETLDRLAATGAMPVDARVLTASFKLTEDTQTKEGDNKMDKDLIDKVSTLSSDLARKDISITEKDAKITSLTAQLAEAETKIATLDGAKGQSETEITARAEKAEAKLTEATAKLLPHVKAALVASGAADATPPEDLVAMLTTIEEKGLKLHQAIGAAQSDGGKKDVKQTDASDDRRKEAFRVNKK